MTADVNVTEKLAEWEALTEGATDGPWEVVGDGDPYLRRGDVATRGEPGDRLIVCENAGPDSGFIAAARTAMPALLAAVQGVLTLIDEDHCPGGCEHDAIDAEVLGDRIRRALADLGVLIDGRLNLTAPEVTP
jgi:hypothetical protein